MIIDFYTQHLKNLWKYVGFVIPTQSFTQIIGFGKDLSGFTHVRTSVRLFKAE